DGIKDMHGADYFINHLPSSYHPRKYIENIKAFSMTHPAAVAKAYNRMLDEFLKSGQFELRDYAMSAKRMNKDSVNYYNSTPNLQVLPEDNSIMQPVQSATDTESSNGSSSSNFIEAMSNPTLDNNSDSSTSTSTSTTPSSESTSSQDKRKRSRSSASSISSSTKKQIFIVHVKVPNPSNTLNEDNSIIDSSSGLKLAFRSFQKTSAELVAPRRDISKLLPEALKWILKLDMVGESNNDQQLLAIKIQSMFHNLESGEQLMDDIVKLYMTLAESKESMKVWIRLIDILPARFEPHKNQGELGFILTRLQCFLDVVFGQRSNFPVMYNIKHESGNGVRPDFFIEIPSKAFSSIFGSEIVGLFGE
ncbi:hypothetical protein BGZ76_004780, partial [Entomortierella beljakovae]